MRIFVAALLGSIAIACIGGTSAAPAQQPVDSAFGGLGTWVDIYDGGVYRAPEVTASRMAARGVTSVWAETANFGASVDVVKPKQLGRLVDALHARGIKVVAWYLPGHVDPARRHTPCSRHAPLPNGDGPGLRCGEPEHRVDEAPRRRPPLAARARARAAVAPGSGGDADRNHPLQPARTRAPSEHMAAAFRGRSSPRSPTRSRRWSTPVARSRDSTRRTAT